MRAVKDGCRREIACQDLGIGLKTLQRWEKRIEDKRKGPTKVPCNKLTDEEVKKVIQICTSEKYRDLSPRQIVPKLADEGFYVASESSMYRILKMHHLLSHREESKPKSVHNLRPHIATGPNQIWSWDITYLKSPIGGEFYYLYLFIDIWSRKIVGWDVFEKECMEYSSLLVEKAIKIEGIKNGDLVIHSDNGGPMKGATMLATMQKLGVIPSFSRPSVSDDNPYSESLFRTLKYCPEFPKRPFCSLIESKNWVNKFVDWYNHKL